MTPADFGDDDRGTLPLSIVIIAENEEDRIGGCIESVVAAAERAVSSFEVVLVDSASTDRTVGIAEEYPITTLEIPPGQTVSCGAGRYVGDRAARGELVLHVDGDMRLTETWLAEAVATLREEPDVAAVEGWLKERGADEVQPVRKVGGVMCYDAEALASVGGFDPFLHGYEDVDVGYRLSAAGYRLLRLPSVSADHPTSEGTLTEPLRRWREGFQFAPGQAIRKARRRPRVLLLLLSRLRYEGLLLAWAVAGLAATVSLGLLAGWLAVSGLAFGLLATRLGVRTALQLVVAKTLGVVGFAYGLTMETRPADEYPVESVTVVQEGDVLEGDVPKSDVSESDRIEGDADGVAVADDPT